MEKRCCICGKDFIGYGNNANPIKNGICCDSCNNRFVIPVRIYSTKDFNNYEIVRDTKELSKLTKKLKDRNFEKINVGVSIMVYQNPETEEKVIILFP